FSVIHHLVCIAHRPSPLALHDAVPISIEKHTGQIESNFCTACCVRRGGTDLVITSKVSINWFVWCIGRRFSLVFTKRRIQLKSTHRKITDRPASHGEFWDAAFVLSLPR